MTGGLIVSLGRTGVNFGAGMSGGLAFIYDEDGHFDQRYNPAMVEIERLSESGEIDALKVISAHADATTSPLARIYIEEWENTVARFWKVVPRPSSRRRPKTFSS